MKHACFTVWFIEDLGVCFEGVLGPLKTVILGYPGMTPYTPPTTPMYMYPMYTVYSTPMCTCTYVPMYIGYYRYSTYRGVLLVVVYIGYHTPSTLCTIVPSTIGVPSSR